VSIEALTAVSKLAIMPSGRKFVAIALANYADENGACFPSVQTLSRWTSQGEKTVRRHLDDLETEGFLTRERVRREDGTLGVYRFVLQRPFLPEAKLASGQNVHQPVAKMATHNHQSYPSTKNNNTRGSRLPVDWQPAHGDLVFAANSGWSNEHVAIEVDKFRDYWISQPGQKGVKTDWRATWRNWVRRNLPSHHHGPPRGQPKQTWLEIYQEFQDERNGSNYGNVISLPTNGGRS
jgi:hypothetical protein